MEVVWSVFTHMFHTCFSCSYINTVSIKKNSLMYSINSWWEIKLAVKSPDYDLWLCPPLLYVFGGALWLLSWLRVCFVLWFHSGGIVISRECVFNTGPLERWSWLLFVVFLRVSDLRWRWGEGCEIKKGVWDCVSLLETKQLVCNYIHADCVLRKRDP